jgi:Holliday junction resolvase RusA-like endonuclease
MSRSGHVYTPSATRVYEKLIAQHWLDNVPVHKPHTGPVSLLMRFYFARPKSHYGTGRNSNVLKESAPQHMLQTPDIDNLEKAVMDALNGVAFVDDKQVVYKEAAKSWAVGNMVVVEMRGLA